MAFVLPLPRVVSKLNSSIRIAPRCVQQTPHAKASYSLSVAIVGIAAAGLVANLGVAEAFELPQLQLPSLPSVSVPGLPELPKLGGEQRPKDLPSDMSQEEQGKVEDMMTKLESKKKARVSNM